MISEEEKTITFNFDETIDGEAAIFALYAGLRMYKEIKDKQQKEPGKFSIPAAEAYCMLEQIKEQFPNDYIECMVEYDKIYGSNQAGVMLKIAEVIKAVGETEYAYYKIPHTWNRKGRSGYHDHPITGLEKYKITKEEYDENMLESKRLEHNAFMGRMKTSYQSYERKVIEKGWREKLLDWLKDDGNFSGQPPTNNSKSMEKDNGHNN